jgi:hypothetical protein
VSRNLKFVLVLVALAVVSMLAGNLPWGPG